MSDNSRSDVAILVKDISKLYKLYDKHSDRFKEVIGFSKKKRYHEHYALRNVGFEIKRGECVGIIGTNGAGKSTILKIITGVLNPTEGDVVVNGRISALLELGAGFNPEYTGLENVYINGRMLGFSKQEIDNRLDSILEFADIGEFINQPVKTYSSGMFVRLAFAVAINIDPEILIVDEALSVGDVFFQSKCFHKFEEFKAQGKTILFVSHSMGTIQKYCDRAILLNKGQKLLEGKPKLVIDTYNKLLVNNNSNNEELLAAIESEKDDVNELIKVSDISGEWKSSLTLNPNTIEYGDKAAEIVDFAIFNEKHSLTNTIEKGEEYTIKVKVHFNTNVNNPIIAYTLKDLKGVELTGTNTMIEDVNLKSYSAGQEITVTFKQKMWLQSSEYLLALGCTGYRDGEFGVYHRLYDVCVVSVITDKNTVGVFDSNSKVSVE